MKNPDMTVSEGKGDRDLVAVAFGRVEIGSGAGKNVGQHKSVPLKLFCCSAWGCSSVVAAAAY